MKEYSAKFLIKSICVILAFIFVAGAFCACSNGKEEPDEPTSAPVEQTTQKLVSESKITIGYYGNDSLNPYKAKGRTNAAISNLYCLSLYSITADYNAHPVVATESSIDDRTVTVKISDKIMFSDGTKLTPSDIAYSFTVARKSSLFSKRLENFGSISTGSDSVSFRLVENDVYALNCLDFPIVKFGSADDAIPVGAGGFQLKKSKGSYVLKKNKYFNSGVEYATDIIYLKNIDGIENKLYHVQIGDIMFYYDDHSVEPEKNLRINANKEQIPQNNLVFIGVNSQSSKITPEVRKAILKCLPKEKLTQDAYDSTAVACPYVFNPAWSEASSLSAAQGVDIDSAQKLISKSFRKSGSIFLNENGERVVLNLLVCKGDNRKLDLANGIRDAISKSGLGVEVKLVEKEYYTSNLEHGIYDLYIGEVKLCANMSLSSFFNEDGGTSFGIDRSSSVIRSYADFCEGKIDVSTFSKLFNESLPFVPVCYRCGTGYYSRQLQFENEVCENNLFMNAYSWDV